MKSCAHCVSFREFPELPDGQKPAYDGECRENPPQVVPAAILVSGAIGVFAVYPPVLGDDQGCGKFTPKPGKA